DDLLALAGRAAAWVPGDGSASAAPLPGRTEEMPSPSTVRVDPRSVPIERKAALLRRVDEVARATDPRIHQVTATYSESVQEVLVADSEGLHRTDLRTQ